MISLIQLIEADFLMKVSLKTLNSGITLKTFTQVLPKSSSISVSLIDCYCHSYVKGPVKRTQN